MDSGQGDLEFKTEVLILARLQHNNLVRLLGFSIQGNERLLVYEFVQYGSLDHFLFDGSVNSSTLNWDTRYKIILGIAKGLVYLHEDSRLRIVHRDLKASNVLLDGNMIPKIADFGLAKLVLRDATQETSRIIGTYGYMAPEYANHGCFSFKSDMYSFGVVVLEIVSGQKRFQNGATPRDLLNIAWRNWQERTSANIIDPFLMVTSGGAQPEMLKCIQIALLCVQENPGDRPTVASVVQMLSTSSSL
ncbi:cysteine-rich RLK protein 29 [Perilla frutescens var. hirtella]|uniref:Cysteine-rich RLK protein 29 n=1 Tax=Perilla frutescens var. hirtella TaxID=608512 RepID=A0AAD4IW17_PERFH|nr:cysteine-rich RLK protein 29 [Perilla frutescens var. hirtella]